MTKKTKKRKQADYSRDFLCDCYRTISTIRQFEKIGMKLYRDGFIRGYFHPYLGEEAIAVGATRALEFGSDYVVSTHRGHGHCISWGGDLKRMIAELLGRADGFCRGRGGSMHIADISTGNLGANGVVGAGIPLGLGAALASSIRKDGKVALCFFSDGASQNGVFAESMNLAGAWQVPYIMMLENNQYAVSTTLEECTAETDLYKRGIGYGIASEQVDGNDVLAVYEAVQRAAERGRAGDGPSLIEAVTYRHTGHHVNDPGSYMPEEQKAYYAEHDPIKICRSHCKKLAEMDDDEIDALDAEAKAVLDEAVAFAKNSPEPSLDEFLAEIRAHA